MADERPIERRQVQHPALAMEYSFLFRVAPRYAWPAIISMLCMVAATELVSPRGIWFGPIYLAMIALTAWALSCRIAIAIGLVILAFKLATGTVPYYSASDMAIGNLAVRILGVSIVVGFIGLARKSCEREWRSARTDQLTGALNRQAFFEMIKRDQGSGGWSAMIFADLDGLKRLNDDRGHAQGDRSLKAFAETIRNNIRKGDVFARMGGDEFVIFMKLRDEEAGFAVAGRLHAAINGEAGDNLGLLKCSMGVLLLPGGSKSIDDELSAADELMYRAKQTRSGICVSTAVEIDGKLALPPPIAPLSQSERGSVSRQVDRSTGAAESAPAQESPPPKSRAAA